MLKLVLYSCLGILGTGIGGVIAIFIRKSDKLLMTYLLNLAAGIMISISSFSLIPEAIQLAGIFSAIIGAILGAAFIQAFNYLIDTFKPDEKEFIKKNRLCERTDSERQIYKTGLVMLVAISLHNLPEGLAIGGAGAHDIRFGLIIALTIAFHDIPEGIAIAVPFRLSGMSKRRTVMWTALSGATTVIGALLGYAIGGISDAVAGFSMALAGGAMIFVTMAEMIPQAVSVACNRKTAVVFFVGFLMGLIVVFLA